MVSKSVRVVFQMGESFESQSTDRHLTTEETNYNIVVHKGFDCTTTNEFK